MIFNYLSIMTSCMKIIGIYWTKIKYLVFVKPIVNLFTKIFFYWWFTCTTFARCNILSNSCESCWKILSIFIVNYYLFIYFEKITNKRFFLPQCYAQMYKYLPILVLHAPILRPNTVKKKIFFFLQSNGKDNKLNIFFIALIVLFFFCFF